MKWYLKSAEQGYVNAQYNLGVKYANGEGVPEDDAEAVKWYRRAAEQGSAPAQSNLGALYYDGKGVPQDYVYAYKWWNLAAAQGNEAAKSNKEIVVENMTKEQIAEAQKQSREWLAKRAEAE
jgi:TPR repeat protein